MGKLLAPPAARRLALAGVAAATLLLGAELGLRAAKIGAPAWYRPDPALGWALRPYARGLERGEYAFVNAMGERDHDHPVDKREGIYRIAVLGDERSEALGTTLRETWWRRLPAELDRCSFQRGRRIEVLNFAVGGYSTAQESIVLETRVMRYRPDLVLLQFSSDKDVRENSRALAARVDRPFYAFDGRGRLRLDESFVELRDFERRSQFRYELARELIDSSRLLQLLRKVRPVGSAYAGADAALEAPRNARWEDAWRVTEALLERIAEFAGRNGARFALVAAAGPAQLERNESYSDLRLMAFGARHGIPVVALAPQMRPAMGELYSSGGRWTPAGHRAAARAVAAGLCRAR